MTVETGTPYGDTANALWDRLAQAVGAHDVSFEDRQALRAALDQIPDGDLDGLTWEKLPEDVRKLVEKCEAEPRTSWNDPADAPDSVDF